MQQRLRLPTLLLISDQAPVRAWFKKQLEEQFYLLEATTAQEAFQAAAHQELQFIVLDAALEGLDLFPFCQELKKRLPPIPLPFFLITGRLKKSFREAALDAGITDFLSDQLDADELETRVATAERARLLQKKTSAVSSALPFSLPELSAPYLKQAFQLRDQTLHLIDQAKGEGTPLFFLFFHLDSFSSIQAHHGYWQVQTLLTQISAVLSSFLQQTDLLIPTTEGHWIVLLPNSSLPKAKALAEHMRQETHLHPFSIDQESFHITLSVAFSALDASESAFHRMIATAIKALKQAHAPHNLIIPLDTESSL